MAQFITPININPRSLEDEGLPELYNGDKRLASMALADQINLSYGEMYSKINHRSPVTTYTTAGEHIRYLEFTSDVIDQGDFSNSSFVLGPICQINLKFTSHVIYSDDAYILIGHFNVLPPGDILTYVANATIPSLPLICKIDTNGDVYILRTIFGAMTYYLSVVFPLNTIAYTR